MVGAWERSIRLFAFVAHDADLAIIPIFYPSNFS